MFNSFFALTLFLPTLIETFKPSGSYFLLKSLYFWFASATKGVKKMNFFPSKTLGIPAISPTKVLPLPVAETTRRFSPFNKPFFIDNIWTGKSLLLPSEIKISRKFLGILSLLISISGISVELSILILSNNVKSGCFIGSNFKDKISKTISKLPVCSSFVLKFLKTLLS